MAIAIEQLALSRLNLSAHCSFHQEVIALVGRTTAAALHAEALMAEYKASVGEEFLISNRQTTYITTALLKRADTIRDNAAGLIVQIIYSHLYNVIEPKVKAAQALCARIAPFKAINRRQYVEATQAVTAMVAVLRAPDAMEWLRTLHLTEELDELEARNKEVDRLLSQKHAENTARAPQTDVDTRQARRRADAVYARLVAIVNAHAIARPTEALLAFIRSLNGQIATYRKFVPPRPPRRKAECPAQPPVQGCGRDK